MYLDVAPNLLGMGLSAAALIARNVDNTRTSTELIAYRRTVGKRLAAYWKNRSISANPSVQEYHRIHNLVNVSNESPAPEKLVMYVRRNRDFTDSGAVVDCYNIVSAKTLLSIGAHDLDEISLPVTLRLSTPQDVFVPLGQSERQQLQGDYGYVDAHGQVLCRLDVLQCEHTKVTRESRNIIFLLQGNRLLPASLLLKGAWLLAEMINRFCGGTVELMSFLDARSIVDNVSSKPPISIEMFKQLNLQKGMLLHAAPIASLPTLSAVAIQTHKEIKAVVPSSVLSDKAIGQNVLVATNLHPLTIAGEQYTSYLLALHGKKTTTLPDVEAAIPDGSRLY